MKTLNISRDTEYLVLGDSDDTLYDVVVTLGDLNGSEGNAWMITSAVRSAIRKEVGEAEAKAYSEDARSSDYINLLLVTGKTVMALVTALPQSVQEELELRQAALRL